MLVCLGAAMVMMTNQYVYQVFNASDPVRMGAQVVSGIGFLGAGTIITTRKNQVKGITTAAGLWAAGCCGLAIGIGFYEGALVGGIAAFIIMSFMQKLDGYIHSRSNSIDLYVEFRSTKPFSRFMEGARELDFEVMDIQITRNPIDDNKLINVTFTAKSLVKRTHSQMMEVLSEIAGVRHIEEV